MRKFWKRARPPKDGPSRKGTTPVPGAPGWRADAEGNRFYSAAWLGDVK